jgi:hypothetical protein
MAPGEELYPCTGAAGMLDFDHNVRAALRLFVPGAAPKAVIAALMALLILAATILSVCSALHQTLHHDPALDNHLCLICSLVKGQASGAETPVRLQLGELGLVLCLAIFAYSFLPVGFDYCLFRGRAPPVR